MLDEKKRGPYLQAGEGDDEMADATFKKKKNWQKFWKTSKKELSGGRKNKKKTNH